jgi:hypothetical protein
MIAMFLAATLSILNAFAHPASGTAAVYLSIRNAGDADALIAAKTDVAASATLHESMSASGMHGMPGMSAESMVAVSSIKIPAGKTTQLAPGGYHIMLDGLKHALKAGDRFTVYLHFARAGWIAVPVAVQPY